MKSSVRLRVIATLLLLVIFVLFQNCGVNQFQVAPGSTDNASDIVFNDDSAPLGCKRWPRLCGLAGPYAILGSAKEVFDVKAAGLNMVGIISPYGDPANPYRKAIIEAKMPYIDLLPSSFVFLACKEPGQIPWACVLSEERKNKIMTDFKAHLAATQNDPYLIAYWILDDNPGGDLKDIMIRMRNAVMESNANGAIIARPTVCGFGSILDLTESASLFGGAQDDYVVKAISNFTPQACDFVALYNYAYISEPNKDPSKYDWAMSAVLPREYFYLRAKGWDPNLQPVIGMPSAFGYEVSGIGNYLTPREEDLQTQTRSFCEQGAVSLFPYTWNDLVPNANLLGNNKPMLDGFLKGFDDCKALWRPFKPTLQINPSVVYVSQTEGSQMFEVIGAKGISTFTIYGPDGTVLYQEASKDFPTKIWPNKSSPPGEYTIIAKDENGAVGTALFKIIP